MTGAGRSARLLPVYELLLIDGEAGAEGLHFLQDAGGLAPGHPTHETANGLHLRLPEASGGDGGGAHPGCRW